MSANRCMDEENVVLILMAFYYALKKLNHDIDRKVVATGNHVK